MSFTRIEDLRMINYSVDCEGRVQTNIAGEVASIRAINPADRGDMERLRDLDHDPSVYKWLYPQRPLSDPELFDSCRSRLGDYFFVITGTSGWVKQNEIGELQGWASIDRLSPRDANYIKKSLGICDNGWLYLQVGYARLPRAREKQISSGLRQVCLLIPSLYSLCQLPQMESSPKIHQSSYPKVIVAALIRADNITSIRVAEASGFFLTHLKIRRGRNAEHSVYILDWDRLHDIYHLRSLCAAWDYFQIGPRSFNTGGVISSSG